MTVLLEGANVLITNTNPRKEGSGEGMRLASDVGIQCEVPRILIDKLVPDQKARFSDQFYDEAGDIRRAYLFPIAYHEKIEDLKAVFTIGRKKLEFDACVLASIRMTPIAGGYVQLKANVQVHPAGPLESGMLDEAAKCVVELDLATMTVDVEEDAGLAAANG